MLIVLEVNKYLHLICPYTVTTTYLMQQRIYWICDTMNPALRCLDNQILSVKKKEKYTLKRKGTMFENSSVSYRLKHLFIVFKLYTPFSLLIQEIVLLLMFLFLFHCNSALIRLKLVISPRLSNSVYQNIALSNKNHYLQDYVSP